MFLSPGEPIHRDDSIRQPGKSNSLCDSL